ncbi:ATP-binding cassette domain-containing protein [Bacillus sp. SL00103]
MLKVHDLDIRYDEKTPLLSSLSFQIKREDSVALIGPNGIGKSTPFKKR